MAAPTLREVFSQSFGIAITPALFKQIKAFCTTYEVKGSHPLALNSPYLGVNPIYFLPSDQEFLFNACGFSSADVKLKIQGCHGIDKNFKVASDAYNLFTIWLAHLVVRSSLPQAAKEEFLFILFKLLHYKFFTSLVRHNYPHAANEYVMQRALEGMSGKFDIKKPETSTWKLLIEKRCREIINARHSIHYPTMTTFTPEAKVIYIISDVQTRLRNQIKLVNREYYRCSKEKDQVSIYGLSTEVDGGQIIRSVDAMFDQMFSELVTQASNPAKLIDNSDLALVSKLTNTPRLELARAMFIKFCDQAAQQNRLQQQDLEIVENKKTYYVGYRVLLRHLLQDTYAVLATAEGLDFRNRAGILTQVMNVYRSSRITDQRILTIKDSVERMLVLFNVSRREATLSFLKTNFIVYIILRSFRAM